MAQKTKKPAAAPEAAPKVEKKKPEAKVEVIQTGDLMDKFAKDGSGKSTLSPDATVMALNGLKTMIHDNPNAAEYYGMSEDAVKQINKFTLAGFATVLAIEVEEKKSKFAIKMLEKHVDAINALTDITGVSIDTKSLPAPKDGQVQIAAENVKVSKEAKEKIKKEKAAIENAVLDITKIENEEQLKASICAILADMKEPRPYDRINKAIAFYLSYAELAASKSENAEEELKKVKNLSTVDVLNTIVGYAGPNVYSLDGICKLLRKTVIDTNSPVSAYCLFRNASINPKTGVSVDDAILADIVKILIRWSSEAGIAIEEGKIKESLRIQEKNKDKVGIVNAEKAKMDVYNANIDYYKKAIEIVINPSTELADSFEEAYDDEKHALHSNVRRAGKNIFDTYYKGKDMNAADKDLLVKNLKQHCGIIINLFRDPLSRSMAYAGNNIVEMFPKEEKK